ncbi:hypothetical protein ES707_10312 [subsurface metagenome]
MKKKRRISKVTYVTVSFPKAIGDEIDILIEKVGYWPSRSAFAREACLEKIRKEKQLNG